MPGGSLIVPAHIPQGGSLKSRHQLRQTPRRGDALQLQLGRGGHRRGPQLRAAGEQRR